MSMSKKLIAIATCVILLISGFVAAGAASVTGTLAALTSQNGGSCVPSGTSAAGNGTVPGELAVTNTRGDILTLGAKQLQNASQILTTARSLGVSEKGLTVMVITVLQESKFWNYANSSVPESLTYPHDQVGSDHDSVNPFQQRGNWGTVAERMDLAYATKAFFGGPDGPNKGSPAGLLDKAGWESMEPGQAAQAVQVSAYPDAYDQWVPAAKTIIDALGGSGPSSCAGTGNGTAVLPLDAPYNMTSTFGPRDFVVEGASTWHAAVDLQNWPGPCGKPVYATMEGTVTESSRLWLSIKHPDGFVISYLHMYKSQRLVDVGDTVKAGQQIGVVGNEGPSSGCHLDLRINVTENTNPKVAALPIDNVNAPGMVSPEPFFEIFGLQLCPTDWCKRQY